MKFLLTKELGRLATWLRILGFDAAYTQTDKPGSLIIQALRDERTIITRNHRLYKAGGVKIVLIQAEKIKAQVAQVIKALGIRPLPQEMFSRCVICNEALAVVAKEKVRDKVPEYVFKTQDSFHLCPKCQRVYWQGTHWGKVEAILKEVSK